MTNNYIGSINYLMSVVDVKHSKPKISKKVLDVFQNAVIVSAGIEVTEVRLA